MRCWCTLVRREPSSSWPVGDRPKRANRRRFAVSGFLLIDLLVAMLLFAVLSVSVSIAGLASARASRLSEKQAIASALATQQLDIFKSQYRAGVGLGSTCTAVEPGSELWKAGFRRDCDVPDPDAPAFPAGLTSARVRVSWTGRGEGSIALHTVLEDPDD